jgi:hypothetical protein
MGVFADRRFLMKKPFILLCSCMLCGCAYVENRVRDATDIVTAAVEYPVVGAVVWVGPSYLGIYSSMGNKYQGYGFGLRSGVVGSYNFDENCDVAFWFDKNLRPSIAGRKRGKGYEAGLNPTFGSEFEGGWFNRGQAEVAIGAGIGVRAGVNFCEIADFVLGWAKIDICDDDVAGTR